MNVFPSRGTVSCSRGGFSSYIHLFARVSFRSTPGICAVCSKTSNGGEDAPVIFLYVLAVFVYTRGQTLNSPSLSIHIYL